MPTPHRTSLAEIIDAGRSLLESAGLSGLTMQAVADRVGVRAPSLYKRVSNRRELIALVAEATVRDLGDRLDAAVDGEPDPRAALAALAREARSFARERPVAFGLVFAPGVDVDLDPESLARASATVVRLAGELAGEERALDAARTVTAWLNGFVGMELSGAFRLGGEVDRAFEFGIDTLTGALARGT
ncbi:TetR/AcrR family transcriptional regulator [Agromyces subbeticus]|uniref:TetR/AcrR family transcriptional regulator n=1 Tax=Agromyces subbeticus TaxID=293890 RepID=UPI0003B30296|nr:TetR/AcrR family transcriptional regulator [Agromyces subbeticus]